VTGVTSRLVDYTRPAPLIPGGSCIPGGTPHTCRYAGVASFARVLSALSARVDPFPQMRRRKTCVTSFEERLSAGALHAALANELGKLIADFTGRGATRSRAVVYQDLVVCVFEDSATRAEQTLVAAGKAELVRHQRDALQRAMGPQLIAAVERLTGRKVRTFMSGTDESGASSVEAFTLDPVV
jgi:uncharacterized protein YbcI